MFGIWIFQDASWAIKKILRLRRLVSTLLHMTSGTANLLFSVYITCTPQVHYISDMGIGLYIIWAGLSLLRCLQSLIMHGGTGEEAETKSLRK